MENYEQLSKAELIAMLKTKDRQLEGERKNSQRVEALHQQLRQDIRNGKCSHAKTFNYNHGYHTICEICGEEL